MIGLGQAHRSISLSWLLLSGAIMHIKPIFNCHNKSENNMGSFNRGKSFIKKTRSKMIESRSRSLCDLHGIISLPSETEEETKVSSFRKCLRRLSLTKSKKPRFFRSFSVKRLKPQTATPILRNKELMASSSSSSVVIWEELFQKCWLYCKK